MTTTPSLPAPTSRHAARVAPQRADGPHPVAAGPGPAAPADPSLGRTGARFHGGAAPAAAQRAGAPTRAAADLPVVLRGYDRGRVDALLRARAAREEELRTALELAERRRAEAVAHAEATQAENDSLRAAAATSTGSSASTTPRATPRATPCWSRSRTGCGRWCAGPRPWPGWGATSSWS
ncbi:hypothetical protein GCM10017691_27430 [Pseudonocardia petroleophila]|uniref:hypothetical protein n=1 Tax=Pseudonocardia petroleophila TaxID=37331 RepID=UPI002102735F|nr:hypothetical protein [Pseudonocardia petroleophila]